MPPVCDPDKTSAQEDLCRFLSACYYEPCAEFKEERLFDSIVATATRLDADLAECALRLRDAFAKQDLLTLLIDYTRLFLGPPQALARPYGSSWLSGETSVMQDSTMALVDLYHQGGFDIDDEFQELPDHVAVELEFLYLMMFNRNKARQSGDTEALAAIESLLRQFLTHHLGTWIGTFSAAVKSGAETSFYRELAELTERFVGMAAEQRSV